MEEKKNVPKRRFEGFEGEWEQHRLGESYHVTMGQSPQSSNYTKNPDDHILVQGNADITNGKIVPRVWTKQITKNAEKGDVILTVRAPVGEVAISNYDIVLGRGVAALKGSYFLYSLLMYMEQIQYWDRFSTGSTFESINSDNIENAIIFIPNILEQQQIGQFFQQLDNLIELHQQKLQKLKAQKQAYLSEMFPQEGETKPKRRFAGFDRKWEEFTLGELGSVASCKRIYKNQTTEIGEIPFYKIGTFGKKADSYISKKLFEEYKSKFSYPKKGDLLLSASGSIGQVIEYQGEEAYFQDSNIVWLALDARVSNLFLKQFYSIVHWFGLEGSTIKRLYNKNILNTKIILPEYNEQQKIGSFFQKLDSLIEKQEERVKKYQALKQAYLNEMFV